MPRHPAAEADYQCGLVAYRGARLAEAAAHFEAALRADPEDAASYYGRALCWRWLRDFPRAVADLDRAIALAPAARFYHERGVVHGCMGDQRRSMSDLSMAIALDPGSTKSFFFRGLGFSYEDDHDRAIADFDRAIMLRPHDADLYRARAASHERLGHHSRAADDEANAARLEEAAQ